MSVTDRTGLLAAAAIQGARGVKGEKPNSVSGMTDT
jgi:hypothetical protein